MTEYVKKCDKLCKKRLCRKVWQIISNSMTEYVQKYVQKMTVNVQKYDRVCLKV